MISLGKSNIEDLKRLDKLSGVIIYTFLDGSRWMAESRNVLHAVVRRLHEVDKVDIYPGSRIEDLAAQHPDIPCRKPTFSISYEVRQHFEKPMEFLVYVELHAPCRRPRVVGVFETKVEAEKFMALYRRHNIETMIEYNNELTKRYLRNYG